MTDEVVATGYLRLIPTTEGIGSALGGQFDGAGSAAGGAFSGSFLKSAKGLLATLGAAVLAKEVKEFVTEGVDALSRIETIQAQTINVIRSTGGAANVSANEVNLLADSLERTTATESESIREGANLLLTFKNIRNEAGAGNDIFNQTVTSLVDVARAMGTDAKGASIQLGKALNDPIAGISALTRVGITFTDEQKELIKSLTESGDLLGAQKIILGELNSQFGGSGAAYAATYAGKLELVKNSFGDIQETLVEQLMPTFGGFLDLAQDVLTRVSDSPTFDKIVAKLNLIGEGGTENLGKVIDLFEDLSASGEGITAGGVLDGLKEIFPTLEPLIMLGEQLAPIFPEIKDGLISIVEALTSEGVLEALMELVTEGLPPLVDLLVAITPLIPPLADLLTAVLVPALAHLNEEAGWAGDTIEALMGLFQSDSILDWMANLQESGNSLLDISMGAAGFVKDLVNPVIDGLNGLGDAVEGFLSGISNFFGGPGVSIPDIERLTSIVSISRSKPIPMPGPSISGGATFLADGGTVKRPGWAIVGEAGPELLNLDVGAEVRPLDNVGDLGRGGNEFHVHAAPGMDESALARKVAYLVDAQAEAVT